MPALVPEPVEGRHQEPRMAMIIVSASPHPQPLPQYAARKRAVGRGAKRLKNIVVFRGFLALSRSVPSLSIGGGAGGGG